MNQEKNTSNTNWLRENHIINYFLASKSRQFAISIAISIVFVITGYVWFISFGFWTTWRSTTDYYDQMATSFAHGSLALEKNVEPALLSLTNPYSPKERKGVPYPLDFSLYEGKYYLYFGPAPALLLAIFKLFGIGTVRDHLLTFVFISGISIFQALLIIEIWKRFFPRVPAWIIPICIVFSGLVSPSTWILTEARVYEVANTGGQFFLIAGIYFNLCALREDPALPGYFFIGGILWALALGSRLTQALPIGFLVLLLILQIISSFFKTRLASRAIYSIVSLGLPLVIGTATLGWYNWARFGSFSETGYSYQLTTSDLQKYSGQLFSPLYVLPNLYEYFAAPPKVINIFPFLQPVRGKAYLLFPFLDLPRVYYTRATTGIIYNTPFILFAGISVLSIFLPEKGLKKLAGADTDAHLLKWLSVGSLGSFLFGLAPFITFFWVETRYVIDFSPPLIMLSIIGFWLGYTFLSNRPIMHKIYTIGGVGLMVISVVISSLLVFAFRSQIYQAWHPVLWNQLSSLFSIFSR